jgi:hypothetical protein
MKNLKLTPDLENAILASIRAGACLLLPGTPEKADWAARFR